MKIKLAKECSGVFMMAFAILGGICMNLYANSCGYDLLYHILWLCATLPVGLYAIMFFVKNYGHHRLCLNMLAVIGSVLGGYGLVSVLNIWLGFEPHHLADYLSPYLYSPVILGIFAVVIGLEGLYSVSFIKNREFGTFLFVILFICASYLDGVLGELTIAQTSYVYLYSVFSGMIPIILLYLAPFGGLKDRENQAAGEAVV